ncbi:MAG: DNA-binding protein [Pseudomonas sp.]|uniref:DNA-binding protein n=1 Tax=Acidovorax sp. TaxID=1872122 RepID=UPI0035A018F1|nr:DNA-binding protein [Pseudomonas sp.]
MTEQQVRAALKENRMTIADWARARGFSVELSRMVLAGKRKCLRGQSREIAIALGLRAGLSDQG